MKLGWAPIVGLRVLFSFAVQPTEEVQDKRSLPALSKATFQPISSSIHLYLHIKSQTSLEGVHLITNLHQASSKWHVTFCNLIELVTDIIK